MKNKRIFLLFGVILIILAGFLYQSAAADGKSLRDLLFPPSEFETFTDHEVATPAVKVSLNELDFQSSSMKEKIDFAQALINKVDEVYLTSGWLHLSYFMESFNLTQQTFEDGTPIPTSHTDELWALIGDDGDVIKAVQINDTGDPFFLQIAVYEDDTWTHLQLPEMSGMKEDFKIPSLDINFASVISGLKPDANIETEETEMNGEKVVVYNIKGNISELKYYFSMETGLVLKVEVFRKPSNGELELSQRIETILIKKMDSPPDEILEYFSK